jgi:hypothetical protein
MLTILVLLIVSVIIFVVLMLVIVVAGIRKEPPNEELSEQASSLVAVFVRRLLGLHVRKPGSSSDLDQGDKGHASLSATPLVGPTDKPTLK